MAEGCIVCGALGEPFAFACPEHWKSVSAEARLLIMQAWYSGASLDYLAAVRAVKNELVAMRATAIPPAV